MRSNLIICIAALALSIGAFIATNNAAMLAVAFIATVAPPCSIAFGRATARRTAIAFDFQRSCTTGQPLDMAITVRRPALSRNRIELTLRMRNVLTGVVEDVPVSLAPASGAEERFAYPLNTECYGRVEVQLLSARAIDSLGFSQAPIDHVELQSSYTVYPPISDIAAQTTRALRSSISGTAYDYHRKGQDRTEVFDMRGFNEGDSLKAVHWKLSARFGELLVREPSRPTDHDIMLLCDAHTHRNGAPDAQVLNAVMAVAASVSLSLVRQGLSHSVAHLVGSDLQSCDVETRATFNTMLDDLVSTPLPRQAATDDSELQQYRRTHNVTRIVLVTDVLDEGVAAKIARSADLTVLHISEGAQAGTDETGGYLLTHIPAAAVGERIKNLEL